MAYLLISEDALLALFTEARMLEELVERIRDALGTDEVGDDLIEVARNAHRAEMELGGHYLAGTLQHAE
jgi:hypothetical protein